MRVAASSLLDRAFQLARGNGPFFPGPANARAQLAIEFSEISSNPFAQEFFDAYDRALALLNASETLGDQLRDDRMTRTDALRQLESQHPGFGLSIYDAAIGEGLSRTR